MSGERDLIEGHGGQIIEQRRDTVHRIAVRGSLTYLVLARLLFNEVPFSGEGHRKVWARLRVAGIRSSKARVLRLMRQAQLLAPQRLAVPRGGEDP